MKLNKDVQYALLICLYLTRAGKASAESMAENMKLSLSLVYNIAQKLKQREIISSTKGPGGGYFLTNENDLRVFHVISAFVPNRFLSAEDFRKLSTGGVEERTLSMLASSMNFGLNIALRKKIKDLVYDLMNIETELFAEVSEASTEN